MVACRRFPPQSVLGRRPGQNSQRRDERQRSFSPATGQGFDEERGAVFSDGSIEKTLTVDDIEKLDEAYEINRSILIATGVDPDSIFRGIYEAAHPCCTAAMDRIVDRNLETQIENLYISDTSVFPTPLGIPPILTIVAVSKRLANYLLIKK